MTATVRDSSDVEIMRLHALTVAQASRIRELEEALARCVREGVRLRAVLRYEGTGRARGDF